MNERRKQRKKAKERMAELLASKDTANLQDFFLQEIQLGELWLAKGEPKKSIEHLVNAISVCTHPSQLMQVLEQTLPPRVFEMLVHSIPYTMQVGAFEMFQAQMIEALASLDNQHVVVRRCGNTCFRYFA
ncbi:hypothetical protein JRQ81_001360 [Phrynocephalus forsythii]|uniref:TOMM20-like protein 1 n=1 Tax=Phrynocephalus forsythii TaxID=171643 RepID=A0A9Q0Y709_9SAUR|nr:hypothetical protein JRQ81_001360 [Phrynocephalus forsythii]